MSHSKGEIARHGRPVVEQNSRQQLCTRQRTVKLTVFPVNRGQRLHDWLHRSALRCAYIGATRASAIRELHRLRGDQARPGEIEEQVDRAYSYVSGGGKSSTSTKWPVLSLEKLSVFFRRNPATVEDFAPLERVKAPEHPADILIRLWKCGPDTLACMSEHPAAKDIIKTLGEWRTLCVSHHQMVVPNPMTGDSARNRRTSCGFDAMRFIVVEPDIPTEAASFIGAPPQDICSSLILHLLPRPRLRMVVSSAGKSLHAWLACEDATPTNREAFFRKLAPYGIDRSGRLPEQQFRLPNGTRDGRQQSVLFFKP